MRFALAIVAFVAAAVMIGLGIAQRTVFMEADRVSMSAESDGESAFMVIGPDALAANPGKQEISVSGDGPIFISYGRTTDVQAWLGEIPYESVRYDAEEKTLVTESVTAPPADEPETASPTDEPETSPTATPAPTETPAATDAAPDPEALAAATPIGSDLWLDEFTGERFVTTTIDVPEGISVLVASDGLSPAPTRVSLDWPTDTVTPWAGPLIVGGGLVFLVGLGLLASGFIRHKRSRGPRRNLPKGPRGRLPSAPKPTRNQVGGSGGRRAVGRAKRVVIVPALLLPALALSACSADYWPSFDGDQAPATTAPATPVTTADAEEETDPEAPAVEPAVTVPQMERIMRRLAVFTGEVDESRDADLAAERFVGPPLEARAANYTIRGKLEDHPLPPAIPASPLTLTLPQQSTGWPRTVLTIAKNADDETIAPTALVLVQETPRENYHVISQTALVPDTDVPEVAPASIGAPPISPEYKGLVMPTGEVAAAYADILQNGAESTFAPMFALDDSDLDEALNAASRKKAAESENPTATLTVSTAAGSMPPISFGTIDAGAIVAVDVRRGEKSVPNDGGTTGFQEGGSAAALSGFTEQSAKGVSRVSGIQLLFYVPGVSAGENAQIQLLGWSENLIQAAEVK
ncbi:hypothetical protein [Agromyces italicus]|uniref:hypothetical protein n=1 Tax=Agromyces italicus TaxID=279572 RepID=UPI00047A677F|nr:hypothetical protein [Agromyces italicus]